MEAEKGVKPEVSNLNSDERPKKGEGREKRPKVERKNEYDFNADLIDVNTVIPPLPKKGELIPKPDIKQYKEKEKVNSQKIEDIINKKKQIRTEKFKFNRKTQGDSKHADLQGEFNEFQQLKDKLSEVRTERNRLWEQLKGAIDQAKQNNEKLKEYRAGMKGSRQSYLEKLEELQHTQMTKELNKNQEKEINTEIMLLKRKIKDAENTGSIEIKLEKAEDLKEELDQKINRIKAEKEPLDKQFKALNDDLDKRNKHIDGIKDVIKTEKNEKNEEKQKHDKQYEDWKQSKKVRLEKLESEIQKLKEENGKVWERYHQKQDQYWKQKQFIDFIEWQNRVKQRKIADQQRQARKLEFEERDKQREKEEKMKKYIGEIELINQLINFLKGINSNVSNSQVQSIGNKEEKIDETAINTKLAADVQWKKQKGLEVVQSKKSKEDEEPEKKFKKKNKKKQEKKEDKFVIPYNVENMFEKIKIIPPGSLEEIDAKIKELRDRESLFERVAREQSTEEQKELAEKIKGTQDKKEQKFTKVSSPEDEFPTI